MNGFLEQTRTLDARDVDANAEWRISEIFTAMQEAGAAQCEEYNLGVLALREQNLAWVVTRAYLRMERTPGLGETVTVRTWPKPPKHAFFPRYYQFFAGGRAVGCASMLYAQLDLTARRMVKPWLGGNDELTCDLEPPLPLPGNVPVLDAEPETLTRTACYSDLDINGHVNNARYLDWFCDCFPMERHRNWRLCDVVVHYDREITAGETAALSLRREEARSVLKGACGGDACFAVGGVWQRR